MSGGHGRGLDFGRSLGQREVASAQTEEAWVQWRLCIAAGAADFRNCPCTTISCSASPNYFRWLPQIMSTGRTKRPEAESSGRKKGRPDEPPSHQMKRV